MSFYLFIAISFYLNIVCKNIVCKNIVCDVGLNQAQSDHIVEHKFFLWKY